MLDTFYNALMMESRIQLDSYARNDFRDRTLNEDKEVLDTISKNYNDWNIIEPPPTPIPRKRGMLVLMKT